MRERAVLDRLGRWGRRVGLATLALAVLAGPASAQLRKDRHPKPVASATAPEVDPGATLGALTLLAGCVLILTDRARRP
jgi:hypothetical protein